MVDEHRLNITQCSQNIYVQHIKSLQVQHVPRLEEMLIVTDTTMEVKSFMDFTCTRILLLIFLSEPTVLLTASSANLLQTDQPIHLGWLQCELLAQYMLWNATSWHHSFIFLLNNKHNHKHVHTHAQISRWRYSLFRYTKYVKQ